MLCYNLTKMAPIADEKPRSNDTSERGSERANACTLTTKKNNNKNNANERDSKPYGLYA